MIDQENKFFFKISSILFRRMMSSLPELMQKIDKVKAKKTAIKGDANAEKILAAELKELNMQLRQFKESSTDDDKKKYVLKVPKVMMIMLNEQSFTTNKIGHKGLL
jgi:hypothetical protein